MKEKIIKFKDIENVRQFAKHASVCDFDIDVQYNHIVIDGKSIMGLYNLDFSRPVVVKYAGENPTFESFITKLAVNS